MSLGGIIVERWAQECAAQMGRIYGLSGLPMVPFYLKIGLDIGRVFAKCLIFDEFFSSGLPIGCQKYLCMPIHIVKSTDSFLKKGPSRNKWFRQRLQIFVSSGLVIGWWLKLWAGLPYPTQI